AMAFAGEGANLVMCSRSADKLGPARDEVAQSGGSVLAITADLSTREGTDSLKERALQEFGTVHVLINNAGMLGRLVPFMDVSDDEWQQIFDLNVMSAIRVSRGFIPSMQQQKWGRIINLASENGVQPDAVAAQYSLTKAAVINLTKSMSKAL